MRFSSLPFLADRRSFCEPHSLQDRALMPLIACLAVCLYLSADSLAQSPLMARAQDTGINAVDAQRESRIDALIKEMTLEEKVGQLVQYSAGQPTGPGTDRKSVV